MRAITAPLSHCQHGAPLEFPAPSSPYLRTFLVSTSSLPSSRKRFSIDDFTSIIPQQQLHHFNRFATPVTLQLCLFLSKRLPTITMPSYHSVRRSPEVKDQRRAKKLARRADRHGVSWLRNEPLPSAYTNHCLRGKSGLIIYFAARCLATTSLSPPQASPLAQFSRTQS